MGKAGIHGSLFSEIAGEGNVSHIGVSGSQLLHQREGLVLATVIYEQKCEPVIGHGVGNFAGFLIESVNDRFLIITGNNDITGSHRRYPFRIWYIFIMGYFIKTKSPYIVLYFK
jgi:hypothetical protein